MAAIDAAIQARFDQLEAAGMSPVLDGEVTALCLQRDAMTATWDSRDQVAERLQASGEALTARAAGCTDRFLALMQEETQVSFLVLTCPSS
jgi:hypothetical protein